MSRTVRIRGMKTRFIPPWENRTMSIPTQRSTPTGPGINAAAPNILTTEEGPVNAGSAPARKTADAGQEAHVREGLHGDRLADAMAYARLRQLRRA